MRLYWIVPVPPEAVTVNVVVPPLQVMIPAEAEAVMVQVDEPTAVEALLAHNRLSLTVTV